jgi:proteinaceous RNase P
VQERRELWLAPFGSNDDWFWLYGAAARGERGVLISNDLMRDHIFELLRPRFFLKWRRHHQWKYDVRRDEHGVLAGELFQPPVFSTCVQQLPESGAWMLPLGDGRWLCAQPVA